MKLLLTNHFKLRQLERNINLEHVKIAIKNSDCTGQSFQDRIIVRKRVDIDCEIEVIYYKQGFKGANDFVIVTAYYI